MRPRVLAAVITSALFAPFPVSTSAQDLREDTAPSYIAVVDGESALTRDGEREAAAEGSPLIPGDVVRTDRGRLDIVFPDGSAIDVDEFSTLELISPSLLRLTEGRLRITVAGTGLQGSATTLRIDTPYASADLIAPGEYRLSLQGTPSGLQTALGIVRGRGTLANDWGTTTLRSGEESLAWDAAAPSYARRFNPLRDDTFEQWVASIHDQRIGGRSAQYLPSNLRMYGGALEQSGSWEYETDYGYVWYPQVAGDWRPYDDGYWSAIPAYGWTWIGVGAWSWPTHHYGRWGYHRSRWFWIPQRQWAPAWVSWGSAPGYVSWCPLGFDNRPVFALSMATRGWSQGWTVLNRDHFGQRGWNVRQYAVRTVPSRTPFIAQGAAPLPLPRGARDRQRGGTLSDRGSIRGSNGSGIAVPRGGVRNGFPGGAERDNRATGDPRDDARRAGPRSYPRTNGPFESGPTPLPPGQTVPRSAVPPARSDDDESRRGNRPGGRGEPNAGDSARPGPRAYPRSSGPYYSGPEPLPPGQSAPGAVAPRDQPRRRANPASERQSSSTPPAQTPDTQGRASSDRQAQQERAAEPQRPAGPRATPRAERGGGGDRAARGGSSNTRSGGNDRGTARRR